jgi:hypothetical protein
MRIAQVLFAQDKSTTSLLLIAAVAVLSWLWLPAGMHGLEKVALALSTGVMAWVTNAALVYRSGYLKSQHVLGWFFALSGLMLVTDAWTWSSLLGALAATFWMARAYQLTMFTWHHCTMLGMLSALFVLVDPSTLILLPLALFAPLTVRGAGLRQVAQVAIAWLVMAVILWMIATLWSLYSGRTLAMDPLRGMAWTWKVPGPQAGLVLLLSFFALIQLPPAMRFAKRAKRRGLVLSIMAIMGMVLTACSGIGNHHMVMGMLAVVIAPQWVNVQSYIRKPWMKTAFSPSIVIAMLLLKWLF